MHSYTVPGCLLNLGPDLAPAPARADQEDRTYVQVHLTQFSKQVITSGLKLRELVIIPQLAFGHVA